MPPNWNLSQELDTEVSHEYPAVIDTLNFFSNAFGFHTLLENTSNDDTLSNQATDWSEYLNTTWDTRQTPKTPEQWLESLEETYDRIKSRKKRANSVADGTQHPVSLEKMSHQPRLNEEQRIWPEYSGHLESAANMHPYARETLKEFTVKEKPRNSDVKELLSQEIQTAKPHKPFPSQDEFQAYSEAFARYYYEKRHLHINDPRMTPNISPSDRLLTLMDNLSTKLIHASDPIQAMSAYKTEAMGISEDWDSESTYNSFGAIVNDGWPTLKLSVRLDADNIQEHVRSYIGFTLLYTFLNHRTTFPAFQGWKDVRGIILRTTSGLLSRRNQHKWGRMQTIRDHYLRCFDFVKELCSIGTIRNPSICSMFESPRKSWRLALETLVRDIKFERLPSKLENVIAFLILSWAIDLEKSGAPCMDPSAEFLSDLGRWYTVMGVRSPHTQIEIEKFMRVVWPEWVSSRHSNLDCGSGDGSFAWPGVEYMEKVFLENSLSPENDIARELIAYIMDESPEVYKKLRINLEAATAEASLYDLEVSGSVFWGGYSHDAPPISMDSPRESQFYPEPGGSSIPYCELFKYIMAGYIMRVVISFISDAHLLGLSPLLLLFFVPIFENGIFVESASQRTSTVLNSIIRTLNKSRATRVSSAFPTEHLGPPSSITERADSCGHRGSPTLIPFLTPSKSRTIDPCVLTAPSHPWPKDRMGSEGLPDVESGSSVSATIINSPSPPPPDRHETELDDDTLTEESAFTSGMPLDCTDMSPNNGNNLNNTSSATGNSKRLICSYLGCNTAFTTGSNRIRHEKSVHSPPVPCQNCGKLIQVRADYNSKHEKVCLREAFEESDVVDGSQNEELGETKKKKRKRKRKVKAEGLGVPRKRSRKG